MQADFRRSESIHQAKGPVETSISDMVKGLVNTHRPVCDARGITVELDVQPFSAHVNQDLIKTAIMGLLENAIDTTPDGGEISVTSIDGLHQWEIEVADSSWYNGQKSVDRDHPNESTNTNELPVVIPFPATDQLRQAYRAAFEHDGQIECWRCPQGGLAYALVVPRRRNYQIA